MTEKQIEDIVRRVVKEELQMLKADGIILEFEVKPEELEEKTESSVKVSVREYDEVNEEVIGVEELFAQIPETTER